jgi:hypothetical protein
MEKYNMKWDMFIISISGGYKADLEAFHEEKLPKLA